MALNNTVAAATPAVLDPVQPVPVSSTEVIVIGQSPTKIHQLEPQEEVVILGPAPPLSYYGKDVPQFYVKSSIGGVVTMKIIAIGDISAGVIRQFELQLAREAIEAETRAAS